MISLNSGHVLPSAQSVMKCVDCKFWNRAGRTVAGDSDIDGDDATDPDFYQGDADPPRKRCLKILHGVTPVPPVPLAMLTDGSGYAAALWTAPEFGCVLFEVRP